MATQHAHALAPIVNFRERVRDLEARKAAPEDLDVQVRTDGDEWHRRAIGGHRTACGQDLTKAPFKGGSLRGESYKGRLCTKGCFSAYELALSHQINSDVDPDLF